MSKELLQLWHEYKTTEHYQNALQGNKLAAAGMGFMSGTTDIFSDFMGWLSEKQGTSA